MKALLASLSLAACVDAADEPTWVVGVGVILEGSDANVQAPAVASSNEAFDLTITTYGDGCTKYHSTTTVHTDDGAIITPYDQQRIDGGLCTQALYPIPHELSLRIEATGVKTLHINGLNESKEPVEVAVEVLIQ